MNRVGKLIYILAAIFANIAMLSCSNETRSIIAGSGRIIPSVTIDNSIKSYSTSASAPNINPSNLSLTISSHEGYQHTWQSWLDYDDSTPLLAGAYSVWAHSGSVLNEGIEMPAWIGSSDAIVTSGEATPVAITCKLANTILTPKFNASFTDIFPDGYALIHSLGGSYIPYSPSETEQIYMRPGNVDAILTINTTNGDTISFRAATLQHCNSAEAYGIEFSATDSMSIPVITTKYLNQNGITEISRAITPEFINEQTPEIRCVGFTPGQTISTLYSNEFNHPIAVSVPRSTNSLILSIPIGGTYLSSLPPEIDLMQPNSTGVQQLAELGMQTIASSDSITFRFDQLLSALPVGNVKFALMAFSASGKAGKPVTVNVTVNPVNITLVSVSSAMMGIDEAYIEVESPVEMSSDISIKLANANGTLSNAKILKSIATAPGRYRIEFEVPDGNSDIISALYYAGAKQFDFTVIRVQPQYSISVDAYALYALVKIVPQQAAMLSYITNHAQIYINSHRATIIDTDTVSGILTVSGLSADTRYDFSSSLFANPTAAQLTETVQVVTEHTRQLPNSGFEDVKSNVKYNNLPSGGRYSQSIVPIFNRQNNISIDLSAPKNWANCNTKTFCMQASNKNTWYMQPSTFTTTDAYSGGYAVQIQSVAWDINGPQIADYLQEKEPYVAYSRVVPEIAHRAAGRLFLGDYSFNAATATETFTSGISFDSRPTAVNGFYKYTPAQNNTTDRGLVEVELTGLLNGAEVVIATAKASLPASASYRAFNIPLIYTHRNIKASRLKIIFASSENIGDISEESNSIITYSNPATSSSIGSKLLIDEISLSY